MGRHAFAKFLAETFCFEVEIEAVITIRNSDSKTKKIDLLSMTIYKRSILTSFLSRWTRPRERRIALQMI